MVAAAPPPAAPPVEVVTLPSAGRGWSTSTVRDGDTLIGIASRHRTSVRALVARNGLADPDVIRAGQRLQVPRGATSAGGARSATPGRVHTVRAGETMSHIAQRYRVPLASLLKANGLRATSLIHPGDRITVRGAAAAGSTATASRSAKRTAGPAARTHTVRSGETLSHVAARYGVTVSGVARASGIRVSSVLQVGQRLRIPAGSSTSNAHPVSDTFAGVTYPDAVVAAARRNHDILAKRSVPSRSEVKQMVARTARRHGVDPRLALAISYQESGWNARAVSPANAVGVMQVIPAGGEWASSLLGRDLDLLDPQDNVTAGVVMLRALGRATSSTETAVAGYYQGLTSVQQRGMYADTRTYVRNIMRLRAEM